MIGLLDSQRSFFSSVKPFASTNLTVDETEQADSVFRPRRMPSACPVVKIEYVFYTRNMDLSEKVRSDLVFEAVLLQFYFCARFFEFLL